MAKMNSQEKQRLEQAISQRFPGYTVNSNAPQGQNGFSANYLLTDKSGTVSLLKVLLRKKIKNTIDQTQALTEINIYKTINSPYVLELIDSKEDSDYIFLQLPYLSGFNLKEYRAQNVPTETEIIDIGIDLLKGISDLHKGKITHQDIKPENIFIEDNGKIKILDFGSARFNLSPFSGTARKNFKYCSPEQIQASWTGSIELLRITIDDRVDVFAAGLILYFLIENKHPFEDFSMPSEAIVEGRKIPDITRNDISPWFKNAILRMLDSNLLNRPDSQTAISFLQQKNVLPPKLNNSGFYYCITSGSNRFIEIKKKDPNLFDGLVIEASQIPKNIKDKAALREGVKTILVDPQFYLFQNLNHCSERFKKLPYYQYETSFNDRQVFLDKIKKSDQEILNIIDEIAEYEINAGCTAIVPPFLYIKEFNDHSWDIDRELSFLSQKVLEKYKYTKPIVKGIAINQQILTTTLSRNRILEYLTSLKYNVEGYMVLLESPHTNIISNEDWLKSAKELFDNLLSTGRYVIWDRADFSGLTLAPIGISMATGERPTQRKFNITQEKSSFANTVAYYYISNMFTRANWPEFLRSLSGYKEIDSFYCKKNCCSQVNFNQPVSREQIDLAYHLVSSVAEQFKRYRTSSGKKYLQTDIAEAMRHYSNLKNNPNLMIREAFKKNIKPESNTFLDAWLNTINS